MALEVKQTVRMAQQLVVTPQLQQAIKLLQLSRVELVDLVQKELLENPVLEEGSVVDAKVELNENPSAGELHEKAKQAAEVGKDQTAEVGNKDGELKEPKDFDWENYVNNFNAPGYQAEREASGAISSSEQPSYENFLKQTESLQDHLLWQLHLGSYSEAEQRVCLEIIGNINDNGYLMSTIEEISAKIGVETAQAEHALKIIQELDPLGVGARDLQECLLLQVARLPEEPKNLVNFIKNHLPDLERNDYAYIAQQMNCNIDRVKELAAIIAQLEPKPGRPFSTDSVQYITPDVHVQKIGDDYVVTLNEDGMPKLQISDLYRRSLMKGSDVAGTTKDYIQERLRAATWLIKSIHQRQRTLFKVTKSILKFQREFFDEGIEYLKPLVLKDVAEDIEMHESTISRVTTNKYVHSPRGIFELKFFFNSGIHQLEGGGVASEAVKSRIKAMIGDEDPVKPLSDQSISEQLKKFNIDIARRTVAKYREVLGILPSSKRKHRL